MNLKYGVITATLWTAMSAAIAAAPYIGTRVPPLPAGCQEVGSGILPDESTHAVRSVKCSGVRMEWLLARASVDGIGGYWNVKDVIVYPKAPDDFEPTRLDCSFDGAKD